MPNGKCQMANDTCQNANCRKGVKVSTLSTLATVVLSLAVISAEPVKFTLLDRGQYSGVEKAREVVLRSASELSAVWKANPSKPAPSNEALRAVDFTKSTIVGVFLGSRPTGGYGVEITQIEREGDHLVVTWRELKPSPDVMVTQAFTAPYMLVTVDKFDGPIQFKRAR